MLLSEKIFSLSVNLQTINSSTSRYMEFPLQKKNMVATDGHRLAKVTIPDHKMKDFPAVGGLEEEQAEFQPCLVPAEFLQKVAKSIKNKKTLPILNHAAIDTSSSQQNEIALVTTDLENTQRHVSRKIEGKGIMWSMKKSSQQT